MAAADQSRSMPSIGMYEAQCDERTGHGCVDLSANTCCDMGCGTTSSHGLLTKSTALSGGYSSTLLQSARGQNGQALRVLEECRKQREQQGSLLRQADLHLEATRKAQLDLRLQ